MSALAVVLSGLLMFTGCAREVPGQSPEPTATAGFPTEDEALHTAVALYRQFNTAYDEYMKGMSERETLKHFLTEGYWSEYSQEPSLSDDGIYIRGDTAFFNESLANYNPDTASLTLAVCRDLSDIQFYDQSAANVTPDDRPKFVGSAIVMVWIDHKSELLIDEIDQTQDQTICSHPERANK
ncbi:hypothetical protein ACSAGD_10425 [Paramicrobacterium sp. CJ85]|uniref:hypothetical protein n=1 Tax=Paramicrobacterium sp. CJ85 TaxID=3445355 RepID=UPI003F640887